MPGQDPTLAAIQDAIGQPPRRFSRFVRRHKSPPRPDWAVPPDEVHKTYDHYAQTLKNGVVCWGCLVQANNLLFEPGDIDTLCQVVYGEPDTPRQEVEALAGRLFALKHTKPNGVGQRKIADMLTDELERALDWRIPDSMTPGYTAYTSITPIPRSDIPDGFFGLRHFPIVADPSTRYAAIVPYLYWPEDLVEAWRVQTRQTKWNLSSQPIVTLTEASAAYLRGLMQRQGMPDAYLRVWLQHDRSGGFQYELNLVEYSQLPLDHEERASFGIKILVPSSDVIYLRGTVIDYKDDATGAGFVFNNPRV